jgi:hypothetical protein
MEDNKNKIFSLFKDTLEHGSRGQDLLILAASRRYWKQDFRKCKKDLGRPLASGKIQTSLLSIMFPRPWDHCPKGFLDHLVAMLMHYLIITMTILLFRDIVLNMFMISSRK